MIDVHTPHEPVTSVKGFLMHLLTITIGVLIALGLEAIVEWRHHTILERVAALNLTAEILSNQRDLAQVLQALHEEERQCRRLLTFLQHESTDTAYQPSPIGMKIGSPEDASWRTAGATGALGYMDYVRAQKFAAAYELQNKLDAQQDRAMQLVQTLDALISDSQVHNTKATVEVVAVESLLTQLQLLRDLGTELDRRYALILQVQQIEVRGDVPQ